MAFKKSWVQTSPFPTIKSGGYPFIGSLLFVGNLIVAIINSAPFVQTLRFLCYGCAYRVSKGEGRLSRCGLAKYDLK